MAALAGRLPARSRSTRAGRMHPNRRPGEHRPSTDARACAARSGVVLLVEERYIDGTRIAGQENYINIRHGDGTIAGYVHLTLDGALVEVGESVERGQPIGLSGDTGSSAAPHLHFHVQAGPDRGTVPVTFRNTESHPRGLREGQLYAALPW